MKLCKILIIIGMIAVGMLGPSFEALAADPPREGTTPQLPEYWGVFVVDCNGVPSASNPTVTVITTMRAKKVVDCEVQTQAIVRKNSAGECPVTGLTEADVLDQVFTGLTLFDGEGDPGIYKVRNFKQELNENDIPTGIYSFDGLIRFWRQ
jgi:hypothetical protein